MATQYADISETIAILCEHCGEVDAAITEDFI
jgi:hypothetical protein